MAYDPNNPFARILRGELPAIRLYEDEATLAFMDIMPQTKGHALVVPKHGGENLLDTEPAAVAAAVLTARRIAGALDRAFAPKGIVLTQFNRAAAGQTVFHLHFHVVPVYSAATAHEHGAVSARRQAEFAELEAQAALIRAALG